MNTDSEWLRQAVELSRQCPAAETFNVGCIIVSPNGTVLATGFSRERPNGMHAEEIAFAKIAESGLDAAGSTLYSSLEPCHPRKSGKKSCTQHAVDHKVRKAVYGCKEPVYFVECKGAATLAEHGIEVVFLEGFERTIQEINAHVFEKLPK